MLVGWGIKEKWKIYVDSEVDRPCSCNFKFKAMSVLRNYLEYIGRVFQFLIPVEEREHFQVI